MKLSVYECVLVTCKHYKNNNFITIINFFYRYYLETSQQRKKHKVLNGLSLIPWFHAYGFISKLAIMCLHIEVIFLMRFEEKQFLETIQNYKVI